MVDLLVSTLTQGSIYMISAFGIVLIYKSTRVLNFAHGYIAAFGGYTAYSVTVSSGQPFVLGILCAVLVGALLGFAAGWLIMVPLAGRSPLDLMIVSVGVSFILQAVVEQIWGYEPAGIPVPFAGKQVKLGGLNVDIYSLTLAAAGIVVITLAATYMQLTRGGLRLRATFDDPVAARLTGISVARVRALTWTAGGALAGASGGLLAPIVHLAPGSLFTILILSFCAVVIGGMTSLPGTIVGGIAAALTFQVASTYVSTTYSSLIVYSVFILFLWVRPHGFFGEAESHGANAEGERAYGLAEILASRPAGIIRRTFQNNRAQAGLGLHALTTILILIGLPLFLGPANVTLGTFLAFFLAILGVSAAMAYADQISFGQVAFMCIGAYATANVIGTSPDRWWLGILAGTAISAILAFIIGLPTVRLRGAYFGIITLALALAVIEIAAKWKQVTGGFVGKPVMKPMEINGWTWYLVMASITAACYLGFVAFRSGALGRRMVAARDNEDGAETMGISVFRWRLIVFTICGTLGGLAGSIYALNVGYLGSTTLDFHMSLLVFIGAVIARSLAGVIFGTAIVVMVPIWSAGSQSVSLVVLGIVLILAMLALPSNRTRLDAVRWKSLQKDASADSAQHASVDVPVSPTEGLLP